MYCFGFLKVVYMEESLLLICSFVTFELQRPGFCCQGLYSVQNVTLFILIAKDYVLELNSVLLRLKTFTSTRQIDSMQSMK